MNRMLKVSGLFLGALISALALGADAHAGADAASAAGVIAAAASGHAGLVAAVVAASRRAVAPAGDKNKEPNSYHCEGSDKKVLVTYVASDRTGQPSLSITLNGKTKTYGPEDVVPYDIGDGFEIRIRTEYEPELHSVFQTIHFPKGKTKFSSKLEQQYYRSSFASSTLDRSRSKDFPLSCTGEVQPSPKPAK